MVNGQASYDELIQHLGDISIVIDCSGMILKITTSADGPITDLSKWVNQNMNEVLTIESREKLDSQLTSLSDIKQTVTKSFELNHISAETGEFPVRYKAFKIRGTSNLLLVGNDLTPIAEIQKKFVNSKHALEREYTK